METKNTIQVTITLPLPATQTSPVHAPYTAGGGCGSTCNSSSTAGQAGKPDPLLEQAGQILFRLRMGQYGPGQCDGVFEVLDAILRRYYTRTSAVA